MIWISLGLNSLAAILLPVTSRALGFALFGLGLFYISFEVVLVGSLTLMSEVLPDARATMMAATLAGFSLGRMLGDLIGPGLYGISFWVSCGVVVLLNVAAAVLLKQVQVKPALTS
jgi:MFS family permease